MCNYTLRRVAGADGFFRFVSGRLKLKQRNRIAPFFRGERCCALELALSIRHIFAHGALTPSAGYRDGQAAVDVCECLTAEMRRVMDRTFHDRLKLLATAPTK